MSDDSFELGEFYTAEELPESEMTNSGGLEWVNDDTLVGVFDGVTVEFEIAGKVKRTFVVDKEGEMTNVQEPEE